MFTSFLPALTRKSKYPTEVGLDSPETLEALMRELCEVHLGRREVKDLSLRARRAFFRRAASGSCGIGPGCLAAARDYRDRSIRLGTPADRYATALWTELGL